MYSRCLIHSLPFCGEEAISMILAAVVNIGPQER